MAEAVVNGAVPTAEAVTASGALANRVEYPAGTENSVAAGGGEGAPVFEEIGRNAGAPPPATGEAMARKSAGKKEPGGRGSERKLTRLRSAAFSIANGVSRMHSRIRAATTGSVPAAGEQAVPPASAEQASPLSVWPPTSSRAAASPFPTQNNVSGSTSAGANNASQEKSPDGCVNHVASSPDHHLDKVEEGDEADAEQHQQTLADNALPGADVSVERTTVPEREVGHLSQPTALPCSADASVATTAVAPAAAPAVATAAAVAPAAAPAEAAEASLSTHATQNLRQEPAAGENASPATTATRASVMSADLGGFYRKLLGEDWQEQLKELNPDTNPLLAFDESDNLEAAVAASGAATSPAGGAGGAAAPGNELQLPDAYQGRMRQRIRRRDVTDKPRDISDQVADDLHFGQDEEPLITPEDIAVVREQAWIPAGEGVPHLSEMSLGYHRAWDIGKKGCLAIKVDGLWDSAVKRNKMRFFVMDGTDPESFLSFYSKSDLHAARGLQSERLGTLTAWDMRDGYWNYPKKKVFVKRSDVKKKKDCILEGFTAEFYDAMLLCIWEMCVQAATEQLKHQRRRERARRRQSLPLGLNGPSNERRRSPTPSGETRRVSAALLSYKDLPRGGVHTLGGSDGGGSREGAVSHPMAGTAKAKQQQEVTAQHKEVMRQLIREGQALLARPITSRQNGAAARRAAAKAGALNKRLPSRRRKAVPEAAGWQPQPQGLLLDTRRQAAAAASTPGRGIAAEGTGEGTPGAAVSAAVPGAPGETTAPAVGGAGATAVAGSSSVDVKRGGEQLRDEEGRGGERKNTASSCTVFFQDAGKEGLGTAEAERIKAVAAAIVKGGQPNGATREVWGGGPERMRENESDEVFGSPLGEKTVHDNSIEPAEVILADRVKTTTQGNHQGRGEAAAEPCGDKQSYGVAVDAAKHVDKSATEAMQTVTQLMSGGGGGTAGKPEGTQGDRDMSGKRMHAGVIDEENKKAVDVVSREQRKEQSDFVGEPKGVDVVAGVETDKLQRQVLDSDEVAASFFAGKDKESHRSGEEQREQHGHIEGPRMGQRRTVHVVSRQAKIRGGAHPEEEVFEVGLQSHNDSSGGGLVERRRRSESTASIGNLPKMAAAGGGAAAATGLGRLFPWRKLGGGGAPNRKEEESGAQGKEKGTQDDVVITGRNEAALAAAAGRSTAAQSRSGRERDREEAAFRGAIQEVIVSEGVVRKPSRNAAAGRRTSSEWNATPEIPSRRTTGKLSQHE